MDLLWKIPVGRFESRRIQFQVRRQETSANRPLWTSFGEQSLAYNKALVDLNQPAGRVAGGVGFELPRIGVYVVQLTSREQTLSATQIRVSCFSCSLLLNAE
jgi:hypothetical protein